VEGAVEQEACIHTRAVSIARLRQRCERRILCVAALLYILHIHPCSLLLNDWKFERIEGLFC
jgi:hypothetical protein